MDQLSGLWFYDGPITTNLTSTNLFAASHSRSVLDKNQIQTIVKCTDLYIIIMKHSVMCSSAIQYKSIFSSSSVSVFIPSITWTRLDICWLICSLKSLFECEGVDRYPGLMNASMHHSFGGFLPRTISLRGYDIMQPVTYQDTTRSRQVVLMLVVDMILNRFNNSKLLQSCII